ncbi:hypothetical protein [Undibacterium sp. KW1]|uniref:hypothetical protein n=1 Tax=Undibacterium sp. KW1 TaxID=2058624 RepID=UPI00138A4F25|nr:hypothetical protein [Undibacterium sp. KW1]
MSNEVIFKSCMDSLIRILNELESSSAPENTKRIDLAIRFAKEIELLWPSIPQFVPESGKNIGTDADPTNYETYKLLKSFGLTLDELVQVAKSENLPELRIVRMVRLVYGVGLDEACSLLKDFLQLKILKN